MSTQVASNGARPSRPRTLKNRWLGTVWSTYGHKINRFRDAIINGDIDSVEKYLNRGVTPNTWLNGSMQILDKINTDFTRICSITQDRFWIAPLLLAILFGQVEVAKFLYSRGAASIYQVNYENWWRKIDRSSFIRVQTSENYDDHLREIHLPEYDNDPSGRVPFVDTLEQYLINGFRGRQQRGGCIGLIYGNKGRGWGHIWGLAGASCMDSGTLSAPWTDFIYYGGLTKYFEKNNNAEMLKFLSELPGSVKNDPGYSTTFQPLGWLHRNKFPNKDIVKYLNVYSQHVQSEPIESKIHILLDTLEGSSNTVNPEIKQIVELLGLPIIYSDPGALCSKFKDMNQETIDLNADNVEFFREWLICNINNLKIKYAKNSKMNEFLHHFFDTYYNIHCDTLSKFRQALARKGGAETDRFLILTEKDKAEMETRRREQEAAAAREREYERLHPVYQRNEWDPPPRLPAHLGGKKLRATLRKRKSSRSSRKAF